MTWSTFQLLIILVLSHTWSAFGLHIMDEECFFEGWWDLSDINLSTLMIILISGPWIWLIFIFRCFKNIYEIIRMRLDKNFVNPTCGMCTERHCNECSNSPKKKEKTNK